MKHRSGSKKQTQDGSNPKQRWRKQRAAGEAPVAAANPQAKAKQGGPSRVLKTLDRAISRAGIASRTEAARLIAQGRVKVNGKTVKEADAWVDPKRDRITVDGQEAGPKEPVHLLLYKPRGYLTTRTDPDGRATVYDLIKNVKDYVFPVGRLDQDTSGLLILTNDSELAEHLTNPDFKVPKTYLVKTAHLLSDEQLGALAGGVELKDGPTRPAEVKRLRDSSQRTFFEITITEGRNRQVRRMVEAIGSKVLKLVRVSIGPLRIGSLEIGKFRAIDSIELRALRRAWKGARSETAAAATEDGAQGGGEVRNVRAKGRRPRSEPGR